VLARILLQHQRRRRCCCSLYYYYYYYCLSCGQSCAISYCIVKDTTGAVDTVEMHIPTVAKLAVSESKMRDIFGTGLPFWELWYSAVRMLVGCLFQYALPTVFTKSLQTNMAGKLVRTASFLTSQTIYIIVCARCT
jgi:hypothetical protein